MVGVVEMAKLLSKREKRLAFLVGRLWRLHFDTRCKVKEYVS